MQSYGKAFARIYNARWLQFSAHVAPRIELLFSAHGAGTITPPSLLDVCCGTGQFAHYFLEKGYVVHGIDLSPHMIEFALLNNRPFVNSGKACFAVQDAASLVTSRHFRFATCLYDAINHLPSLEAISSCIQRIHDSLERGGLAVFDINTKISLQAWKGITVQQDDELFILNQGFYDQTMDHAFTQITGFVRNTDGTYERFSETVYNLVLSVREIRDAAAAAGFSTVRCATIDDLQTELAEPERTSRVFFVCNKA